MLLLKRTITKTKGTSKSLAKMRSNRENIRSSLKKIDDFVKLSNELVQKYG